MKKYASHNIRQHALDFSLQELMSSKDKSLYIHACRQLIKVTDHHVYNIIAGNTSIPARYLDKFGKEIITLDINSYIQHIKSRSVSNTQVSLKAGGVFIIRESIIREDIKVLVTLKINTVRQILKLTSDPDSVLIKLEELEQDSFKINFDIPDLRTLIIDEDSIFTNLFLSGEMIKRLIKLSSIGIIEKGITEKEISRVLQLQLYIRKAVIKNNNNIGDFLSPDVDDLGPSNFNIANLFLCYTTKPYIKLIGTKESFSEKTILNHHMVCLNYIKHIDKLHDVTDKLEGIKLSLI